MREGMGDQMKRKEKPPSHVSCEGGGVVVMPAPRSSRRKIQPSVSRFVRGRGVVLMPAPWWVVSSLPRILRWGLLLLLASQWVMSSSFRERRQVRGKCTPPSRISSEGGDGGQPCTVATVSCLVARPPTLDSMDVRCDEEGFTPPGHIENGV